MLPQGNALLTSGIPSSNCSNCLRRGIATARRGLARPSRWESGTPGTCRARTRRLTCPPCRSGRRCCCPCQRRPSARGGGPATAMIDRHHVAFTVVTMGTVAVERRERPTGSSGLGYFAVPLVARGSTVVTMVVPAPRSIIPAERRGGGGAASAALPPAGGASRRRRPRRCHDAPPAGPGASRARRPRRVRSSFARGGEGSDATSASGRDSVQDSGVGIAAMWKNRGQRTNGEGSGGLVPCSKVVGSKLVKKWHNDNEREVFRFLHICVYRYRARPLRAAFYFVNVFEAWPCCSMSARM